MSFWFGVQEDLLNDEDFIKSKPSDKLYYFTLLHYLNLHEINYDNAFFKRDIDFAAALSYSEDSIRDARRKFQKMGWINVTSGFRTKHGQNVATTYHGMKFKELPKMNEGKRFVKFGHYDFEMMLDRLARKEITHQDMVVYCYLYCWDQLKGDGKKVFVPKKELRTYTNIVKAVDCVKTLGALSVFNDDKSVIDYEEDYHRITFHMRVAMDPYESENSKARFMTFLERSKSRADTMIKDKQEKGVQKAKDRGMIVDSGQLLDLFKGLYREAYGPKKYPDIDWEKERKFGEFVDEHGIENVALMIRKYFDLPDDKIPNHTKSKYKTLSRFMYAYYELLSVTL